MVFVTCEFDILGLLVGKIVHKCTLFY